RVVLRAGHHEQVTDRAILDGLAAPAPPAALEVPVAVQRFALGARVQGDVGAVLDAADQVARHRRGEAVAAHEDVDVTRGRRQEYGGLAGGVAAADDDDLVAAAHLRLDPRGGVVDAGAFEAGEVRERQLAVLHAGGDDD